MTIPTKPQNLLIAQWRKLNLKLILMGVLLELSLWVCSHVSTKTSLWLNSALNKDCRFVLSSPYIPIGGTWRRKLYISLLVFFKLWAINGSSINNSPEYFFCFFHATPMSSYVCLPSLYLFALLELFPCCIVLAKGVASMQEVGWQTWVIQKR